MTEKLSFAVENVELIEESNNSQFATLKIDAFASGNNRHSLYVSEDTLRKTAKTILEKPIIWEYSRAKDDATTHSDNQIICGFIPKDSPIEFKELEDSRIMMSIVGKLWVRYAGKMTDIFKRDRSKSVSVEMEVLEENETSNFGIPELLSYCYQGITVLGEMVTPAIKNAKADLIAFASKEQEEYRHAYELEFGRYDSLDMSIPEDIKKNVSKGLSLYKEHNRGGTSVSLASARFVAKNDKITPDKLRHIAKVHKSGKFSNMTKSPPSDSYISYLLYGGKEGGIWALDIFGKLDELDKKQLSYFGEDEVATFPYKSITDAPPSIQKLNGIPLTVSQANEIATQADSIGGEYAWPTAIKSWKSRHHIEEDHWVKNKTKELSETEEFSEPEKEKNMEDEKDLKKPEEDMAASPPEEKDKEEEMATESKEETPPEEKKEETEEMAVDSKKDEDKEEEKESPEKEGDDKEESPTKEEDEEDEEDKEKKEEKMSLDANLDVAAYLAFLESATEANEEMVAKYKTSTGDLNHAMIHQSAFAKMCKMAEDLKKAEEDKDAYMSENEGLKKFKADIEAKQFAFEIESTLKDVVDTMPKDKVDEAREDSKNFSLDNVDAWKNKVRADAFSYSKDKKPSDGITRMALSWTNGDKEKLDLTNGWVK